jgi:DNA-binding transcriptional MocR family regulator
LNLFSLTLKILFTLISLFEDGDSNFFFFFVDTSPGLPHTQAQVHGGGYFLWLGLPASCDASAIREAAKARGTDFLPGVVFSPRRNTALAPFLRLSFAFYSVPELESAAQRLAGAIADCVPA